MRLKKILKEIGHNADRYVDIDIKGISDNSKYVREGFLFLALKGERLDGYDFIQEAIDRGARVVVSYKDFIAPCGVVKIIVENKREVASDIACAYFENPSRRLKIVGITGTNGKTTTSYLISNIFEQAGFGTGLIGTINYKIGNRTIPAVNTTPGAIELQGYLSEMLGDGLEFVVMEVSSHSLQQERVRNIKFSSAVFTNITQDHLDYHKTFEDYFEAKARLFNLLEEGARAVINIDDEYGKRLMESLKTKPITYGIKADSDIKSKIHKMDIGGSIFEVLSPYGKFEIKTKLIGLHNIYNIMAAIGVGILFGIEEEHIKKGVETLEGVKGRLEELSYGQPFKVFIDYAHTDDALRNILGILKPLTRGRLIVVFGCGGDRDRAKRPLMGRVATEFADYVIITNDNPRSEEPTLIANEICNGFIDNFRNYTVILDRYSAIKEALRVAKNDDIVVIAGKGHETYQVLKDKVIHFDDKEVVESILLNKA
ncbi:MAG: UDP-N-acetylmuramoyl-L-alanyl-D-glutamate--2,6-diaminopimelate ligase [Candidatus Omnitrophica bacterium]|nr:UDP-N-acetylmuramoyl-L-alanyl-D-glutamate--2,6-diaminopimelate ligase [Candidatus Omnitrophota bacterium]